MRIVVTGASGHIGWHTLARLHAANCAARFRGKREPFDIVALGHKQFDDKAMLHTALEGAQAVLHFAGVNRAADDVVEAANPTIATRLAEGCRAASVMPHIVYANSTHSESDTPYGRSKRMACEVLDATTDRFTNLILPHIFGEGARPFYNNVTATLIAQIVANETPEINPDGKVQLLHTSTAAQYAIDAALKGTTGRVAPNGRLTLVPDLFEKIFKFHVNYRQNIYPDLSNFFDRDLFNTYRTATYPDGWPRPLKLNVDQRGTLFEAVKGGGGGQTFLSTTRPGITRGDHFHLNKVERFLVVQGEAIIRIRKVLSDEIWEFKVSGDEPATVDMPTLHTHSIENVGSGDLITLFWTHDLFDPSNPDTFADKVLK
jgi:UDP-2-acetamido-2,6-beta-L-arabino-hexul-4-ose reductase